MLLDGPTHPVPTTFHYQTARIARTTLPVDLVARQARPFIFDSAAGKDEVRFRVLQPGSTVQDAAGKARDGGELTEEKLHGLLVKALRLALAQPI
jgi:hypothetical protein